MKTSTRITLNRKTTFTHEPKPGEHKDRGDSLLRDAIALIREEGHVGSLTAQIGPGGTIANLSFLKEDKIPSNSGGVVFDHEGEISMPTIDVEI